MQNGILWKIINFSNVFLLYVYVLDINFSCLPVLRSNLVFSIFLSMGDHNVRLFHSTSFQLRSRHLCEFLNHHNQLLWLYVPVFRLFFCAPSKLSSKNRFLLGFWRQVDSGELSGIHAVGCSIFLWEFKQVFVKK